MVYCLFAVAEGWQLFDIGLFVLFSYAFPVSISQSHVDLFSRKYFNMFKYSDRLAKDKLLSTYLCQ